VKTLGGAAKPSRDQSDKNDRVSGSPDSESINSDAGTSRRQSITYYLRLPTYAPTTATTLRLIS
jgi:hypothetical protein